MRRTLTVLALALTLSVGPLAATSSAQQFPEHCEPMAETSGFVDEEGCPISIEEYAQIRDDATGMQWDNIAILVAVLVVIGGGAFLFIRSRRQAQA